MQADKSGLSETLRGHANTQETLSFSGTSTFPRDRGVDRTLEWDVKDFRVHVRPFNNLNALSETERTALFTPILKKVRDRSDHPDEFYSAALAITDSGNIYVASNTQRQHEYHKDCAEMNLVNIINQMEGSKAKISRLYLMAGKNADGPAKPVAPCGKCMDTLCACSLPGALITMIPVNAGKNPVVINERATDADEVGVGECWRTLLCGLQIDREVELSEIAAKRAFEGWKALTNGSLPAPRLEEKDVKRIRFDKPNRLSPEDLRIRQTFERAITNAANGIKSEAALDADSSPSSVNRFMVDKIASAYHKRPAAMMRGQREVETVRCVVLRLADGSFHSVTEVEGPHENAVPHAEITAVAASRELNLGITDAWVMSLNMHDIAEGRMPTSPKESLERINKRRPKSDGITDNAGNPIKDDVNMHYIAFNNGKLSDEEVSEITQDFKLSALFPSRFNGSKHDGANGKAGNGSHGIV